VIIEPITRIIEMLHDGGGTLKQELFTLVP